MNERWFSLRNNEARHDCGRWLFGTITSHLLYDRLLKLERSSVLRDSRKDNRLQLDYSRLLRSMPGRTHVQPNRSALYPDHGAREYEACPGTEVSVRYLRVCP